MDGFANRSFMLSEVHMKLTFIWVSLETFLAYTLYQVQVLEHQVFQNLHDRSEMTFAQVPQVLVAH